MKHSKSSTISAARWQARPTRSSDYSRRHSLFQCLQQSWINSWNLGWLGPLLAACLAFLSRVIRLGSIKTLVFDETYYVKDALGIVKKGYEVMWPKGYDPVFETGQVNIPAEGAFVVHPALGKWLIGQGINLFGNNPWGWRIVVCLAGSVSVFILGRIIWYLWGNGLMATLGAVLLSLDGVQIVLSRTAILDVLLEMFILLGVLFVVRDQISYRPKLLRDLLELEENRRTKRLLRRRRKSQLSNSNRFIDKLYWKYGPAYWWRPWLVAAGIAWGLASSIKWSGLYPVAVFGIYVFLRELSARWASEPRWLTSSILAGGIPAFVNLVPVSGVVYLCSWVGWATHPAAWGHTGAGLIADWLRYHEQILRFHTSLVSDHPYKSNPWGWLIQLRPTSFYYETVGGNCGGSPCIQSVTSLANPLLWWLGFLAFFVIVVAVVVFLDWRAGIILAGYFATYVPWLIYAERTIFTFYTVVISPFVVLSLLYVLGLVAGAWTMSKEPNWVSRADLVPRQARPTRMAVGVISLVVVLILGVAVFFFPVWTGMTIPQDHFYWRMWFSSWI